MKVLTPEIIYGWNALFFADTAVLKRTRDYYWSFVKLVRDFDIFPISIAMKPM